MGKEIFTRSLYNSYVVSKGFDALGFKGVTKTAEKQAISSGKLQTLVDPSSFNVVRLSLVRVEERDDGKFELLVGCSMPIETRVDTTGSMGNNVDVALKVLPDIYEACANVLPGYDIHIATGIFGDVSDRFPLCRPQFEMQVDKIVDQLTLMVPERDGGDSPEDPDIGIFGGAYLCRHYINRIGLKGYDFTITDAPGRGRVDSKQLMRVFGSEVFEKCDINGHGDRIYSNSESKIVKDNGIFELSDIWNDLLKRAHAFVLLIEAGVGVHDWWCEHVGSKHVVIVKDMKHVPYVQATIIGLTEGTITLKDVPKFLKQFNIDGDAIDNIIKSVSHIPIKAQAKLKNFKKRPIKGDLFDGKPNVWTDENIWPVGHAELKEEVNDWV